MMKVRNQPKLRRVYSEWITRSFVNKEKKGGYIRIDYKFTTNQFEKSPKSQQNHQDDTVSNSIVDGGIG